MGEVPLYGRLAETRTSVRVESSHPKESQVSLLRIDRRNVPGGLMWSERKHGLFTEQFPLSAYVGSSKTFTDLGGPEEILASLFRIDTKMDAMYSHPRMPCKTTGVPRSQKSALSKDPTVELCLEPYDGPRGGAVSCERGSSVFYSANTL